MLHIGWSHRNQFQIGPQVDLQKSQVTLFTCKEVDEFDSISAIVMIQCLAYFPKL